jgi:hypothetical protein
MYHVVSPYTGSATFLEFGQFIVTYTYVFSQRHEVGEEKEKADVMSKEWLDWKNQQLAASPETKIANTHVTPQDRPWSSIRK